jgi:Cys-tRNA(Pro)/Cys-tRNA(Cys) deacylase
MATRAAAFLKQRKISFELIRYSHEEKGAEFAARAVGYPLARTVKTLVADLGPSGFMMALMPGDRHLNLKRLANGLSVKRAAMADVETAERLTGYRVGGISPFETKARLPVVMETTLMDHKEVMINAGQRGIMLKMAPADIVTALGCRVLPIAE